MDQYAYTIGSKLQDVIVDHASWSRRTFGDDSKRGPLGALKHLEKEAREAQNAPTDIIEYADCLLLLLDASRRAGFELIDLLNACHTKMTINRSRKWPASSLNDEPTEHVRECTQCSESTHATVITSGGYPHHVPACAEVE